MNRLKKILKWTGVVLGGLVAIGLVANAVFVWTADTRLERQLVTIRAAGDPLMLAELARKPIPPEKNAVTYLRRAEADVAAVASELSKVRSVSVWPLPPMPREDQKAIKAALDAYPNAIPLLEQAAACPDYDAQLDYTVSPREFNSQLLDVAYKIRSVALVLNARARMLVNEENRDEAVRTALLMFRLARHFDRNPTHITFFMAMAVRSFAIQPTNLALQTGPVSAHVRRALDAELAVQERMEGYAWTIKSHRAFELATLRTLPYRNFWLIGRGLWNERESELLDDTQAVLALSCESIPYRQADQTFNLIQDKSSSAVKGWQIVPMMQSAHHLVARTRAQIRSLRVLNALQTHVLTGGEERPKLTGLGLPTETITDPFTGAPLHVKKTPLGWIVYSVGPNFQDDGGKIDDPVKGDVGIGPPAPVAKPAKNNQEGKGKS